ncbi:MAG: zinc-dependent metalloprotease [bacterium]|nr:zinc-dependent metalloprotease [bacterium]
MRVFQVLLLSSLLAAALVGTQTGAARAGAADTTPSATPAESPDSGKPQTIAAFAKGAAKQSGLLTLWRKNGAVYIQLTRQQLGKAFIEAAIPENGLGGFTIFPGYVYLAPARIMTFTTSDDQVVITWPNTIYDAKGSAAQLAAASTYSQSVVAVAPIVARDDASGDVIFDAQPFLGDVSAVAATLRESLGASNPLESYRLDSKRTFWGKTEAFPDNVVLQADQTFASQKAGPIDNVPDPRSVELNIDYNIALAPDASSYMPRLADSRVGYWNITRLAYGDYAGRDNRERYIMRWDMQPSDPSKPLSPAKHPLVYYLSDSIPPEYRQTVRDALLAWNAAFERIGISDAVQVRDQPSDPRWSPDDIRYNVVRWVTGSNVEFGAEAEVVYDPRTGQEINVGVLLDGNDLRFYNDFNDFVVDPLRPRGAPAGPGGAGFGAHMRAQGTFALDAFAQMGLNQSEEFREQFRKDALRAIVLHESGHDFGLNHNFIGSEAYTPAQLRSKAFTDVHGVASTVMEYAPVNLWPKGASTGAYFQDVLGPYDYHAIAYGYEPLPGARTPRDEQPQLARLARLWADPQYRFAGDEDASFAAGHAIDPRVNTGDLTDDPLAWCATQLRLARSLLENLDWREPGYGESYEVARQAFGTIVGHERSCLEIPEHFIGGAYLSRSHKGDPGAAVPFQPVSRARQVQAFGMLDRFLFSERAWTFSPRLLDTLVYTEWNNWTPGAWAYDPPARHDVAVADIAAAYQEHVIAMMFEPLMLQRLDQMTMNAAPGATMNLADLFSWMQRSVYADLRDRYLRSIGLVHRDLQQRYAERLIGLTLAPPHGTPPDASALATVELHDLYADLQRALRSTSLDRLTYAHLVDLASKVHAALGAQTVVPETGAPQAEKR